MVVISKTSKRSWEYSFRDLKVKNVKDLGEGHCSPVKMAYHPLNYFLHLLVKYNIRFASSCDFKASIRGLLKPFKSCCAINFNDPGCCGSRHPLLNKTPKSCSFWGLVLLAWCFVNVTSIPACRKTLHAGKNDRYFDFEQLELCTHIDKTQKCMQIVFSGYSWSPWSPLIKELRSCRRLWAWSAGSLLSRRNRVFWL